MGSPISFTSQLTFTLGVVAVVVVVVVGVVVLLLLLLLLPVADSAHTVNEL